MIFGISINYLCSFGFKLFLKGESIKVSLIFCYGKIYDS